MRTTISIRYPDGTTETGIADVVDEHGDGYYAAIMFAEELRIKWRGDPEVVLSQVTSRPGP